VSTDTATTQTVAAHRAQERWFLDRGLPAVLTQRARLRAIWPRSAPFLTLFATLQACSAATYELTGRHELWIGAPIAVQRIGLAVGIVALPAAAGLGWCVARMPGDRSQAIVSVVSAVILVASGAVKGSTFEHHLARLIAAVGAVALVLVLTASGLGSVIGWAVRLALTQIVDAWGLLIRALPVVLLSVLVFFNTAVWAMAASLSAARFALAMVIFHVIAISFVVQETMEHAKPTLIAATAASGHAERLADTPFEHMPDPAEPRPLTRAERFNVVFVLAATQIARIFTVAFVTWLLFFVVGLVLTTPELMHIWSQHTPKYGTLLGYPLPVPQALIQTTLFLGALTFMYVSARAAGDGDYQSQFLDPLVDDLKVTLLARNRYLGSLRSQPSAPSAPAPSDEMNSKSSPTLARRPGVT
jgi:hypothetical protein